MWSRPTGSSSRGDGFDMANNTRRAVFGKTAMSAPEPSLPRDPQCNHDQRYGADRTVHHEVTAQTRSQTSEEAGAMAMALMLAAAIADADTSPTTRRWRP